jgi:glutamate dehydrogenase
MTDISGGKKSLLAQAARVARTDTGVGDVPRFLDAYYRHVAEEDLAEAGAERIAAVAMEQAAFAALRPQGRPLVRVQPAGPAALEPDGTTMDIVTDDMPYLVDSVLMAVHRCGLEVYEVIHPQLRVIRDVGGTMHGVLGVSDGSPATHDEIKESWIHLETSTLSGPAEAAELAADLERVLGDVRAAVEDYPKMRARALSLADSLALAAPSAEDDAESPGETAALLRWLADGHFTFLGYREYDLVDGADGMQLPAVPGTGLGILRHDRPASSAFAALPPEVRAKATEPRLLIVTKANSMSTVHRPHYLDYVAVKRFGPDGTVTGEQRFLGLYTHSAYSESITRIPVLRRKLAGVLAATGLAADSHDGNDLAEFLENYPREELFQIPVPELIPIADGVLRLRDRKQTRLFLRKDPYGRYMSCLVYMPRDRYTTAIRLRAQEILRQALGGASVSYSVMVGESAVSRLHIVVRAGRGKTLPDADEGALERQLVAAIRSWDDDLAEETRRVMGAAGARSLLALCDDAIPDTYKADVPAVAAADDLSRIAALRESDENTAFELWESEGFVGGVPAGVEPDTGEPDTGEPSTGPAASEQHAPRVWRLTIYRTQAPLTLTDVLPRLQHMGVDVVDEHPYEFAANGGKSPFWIYDFGLRRSSPGGAPGRPAASLEAVRPLLEGALDALWRGRTEDDDFNALVLDAALTWRQVVILRGYARYLRQAGTSFSQNYIARVLRSNVTVTRLLVTLFESRFDPDRKPGQAERSEAIAEEISGELDEVASLDQDRILRAVWALIRATLRTNYFQEEAEPGAGLPYFAVKLDPAEVPDLPAPRPRFELFVYSPRFEGVHLRFAHVARGGLRWSERPEDFRTEVLGLAKAQEVKNSVIVPSGAKGGFVCKQLPASGDRDAVGAEVLTCYKMFISAMLDITDNLSAGKVVPPPRVARHDGDDPYLVVAADKGTATFSDTANEIATGYGFWLGDAFASGGSDGYDHKKMGITARGAWESVKFGFQTLGLDTAAQDFTAVGVGDMSGDVFGNGMLRSEHIRLIAAFDHRHVFIDPDPDPAASFAERARLFALPRSSWADYDPALISAGGGVWPRTAKSVRLTPQAAAVLGLDSDAASLTPDQLVSAILAAPVDLLWNGGIGTYVKASNQSHADVGDRSNDSVRIDATALRARVVGEGGNLGLTQEARIEYALAGGLVNTDFIDNSAGVDTSDHEVNMKIVLAAAMETGGLSAADRSRLLHEMTDEVAALVLAHNYQQNRALALARAQAPSMLHVHARYIRKLERDRRVHRRLDVLPGDRELAERRSAGAGLTVPEFSVLLAHTKIATAQDVLASDVPDDPYLRQVLTSYFPAPMRERFADLMPPHRLHREIITTVVVNDMIDRSGITSLFRQSEETGASVPDLTRAWLVARDVLQMPDFWAQVEALDGQVDTTVQIQMLLEGRKLTERAVRWLVANRRPPFRIQPTVDFFADGMAAVAASVPKRLAGRDVTGFEERRSVLTAKGVPADLADRVSAMVPGYSAFDIVQVATSAKRPVEEAAEVYFDLSDRLQIGRLRDRITALPRDDRWSTMARGALRDDLYAAHAALAKDVLMVTGSGSTPEQRLLAWARRNESAVIRAGQTLTEIWESDVFTVAMLSVAVRAIRTLVSASRLPD